MNFFENESYTKLVAFFASHNFDIFGPNIDSASAALFYDLNVGLEEKEASFTQEMLATWVLAKKPTDKKVIVLDAGGTNFRSYLIEIKNSTPKILKSKKGKLPAIEEELTKDEFFEKIADNIEYLKDEAEKINFCFAYALTMCPDGDAKVLRMSKQIKVKGILGELVGASLFSVLKKRGWKNLKKISIINDTVAALLSGVYIKKDYSSYIGMILGTGFNIAYIESEAIKKLEKSKQLLNQIVVCETAKTNRIVASDFDLILQESTFDKNICKLEKMCSGAYLGNLISICFRQACKDTLFTEDFSRVFSEKNFTFQTINEFLCGENQEHNEISSLLKTILPSAEDSYFLKSIAEEVLKRVARIVTAALISVAVKTKKGKEKKEALCIIAEGTTFKKAYQLKQNIQNLLEEHLTKRHGIYFELHEIEDSVAFGTASLD